MKKILTIPHVLIVFLTILLVTLCVARLTAKPTHVDIHNDYLDGSWETYFVQGYYWKLPNYNEIELSATRDVSVDWRESFARCTCDKIELLYSLNGYDYRWMTTRVYCGLPPSLLTP
jgi:hypothetical protein